MPLTILDQDGDTIEAALAAPAGTRTVICRVRLDGDRLVLYYLHVDGPGPGRFGLRRLRAAMQELMEQFDVQLNAVEDERVWARGPGRRRCCARLHGIELRLRGWRPSFDKVRFTRLLRDGGLGLGEAVDLTDRLLADHEIVVRLAQFDDRQAAATELFDIGVAKAT